MSFTSYNFVIFLCAFLAIKTINILTWEKKKAIFVLLSYYYYSTFYPSHVILLFTLTALNYFLSFWIHKKSVLVISIVFNLCVLVFYKYLSFFFFSLIGAKNLGGFQESFFASIVMPLGISFYIFEIISYHVDCHNQKFPTCRSVVDFFLYIAFFPRLAAGPIIRPHEFFPQISKENYPSFNSLIYSTWNILFGLFQKVVIADAILAPLSDKYQTPETSSDAWTGILAFSGQIFCDFNGYSLCAIGLAGLLGISIPRNFNAPYTSILFSDFWRRWHISLSQWFRDYVYIPLGGNRGGRIRGFVNSFLVMILCGLWHGASLTFVVWGALHGIFLIFERILWICVPKEKILKNKLFTTLLFFITIYCVNIAWVFFRQPNLQNAMLVVEKLHSFNSFFLSDDLKVALITYILIVLGQFIQKIYGSALESIKIPFFFQQAILLVLVFFISIFSMGKINGFIYFQF